MECGEKEQLIFCGRVAVKHQDKTALCCCSISHNFCFTDLGWKCQKAKSDVTSLALEGRCAASTPHSQQLCIPSTEKNPFI